MYDDLISSLRICRRINSANDNCIAFHDGSCEAEPVCMYELMDKAADAIEEMTEDNIALNGTITNLLEQIKDLGKPRWIPVTERLPEAKRKVLVATFQGGVYYGFVESRGKFYTANNTLADSWCWEPDVTHWMPLPQPPKEE